jgi:hypothetical protein
MSARFCFKLAAGAFALALSAGLVFGQGFQGTLRATLVDQQGSALPGVTVTITNEGTGEQRTAVSTNAGVVSFPNLIIGRYAVTAELPGFKKFERQHVNVSASQTVDVQAKLEVGELSETVTVTGTDLVKTSSSQLDTNFSARQLTDLPVYDPSLTGDVTNFAVLAPGVSTQSGGVTGQGGSVGGNRPRNNNFVIDGLDNNSPDLTGAVAPVIQDAVEEFTLLTNQFSAEFGHSTAGQFITTTKSGTNEFHGGAWEYGMNRHLNSFDHLTRSTTPEGAEKPRFDVNRFGAMLGGPIQKDKWFFFGAFEYQNQNFAGSQAAQILVPTANGLATLEGLAANPLSGVSPVNVGIIRDHVPVAGSALQSFDVIDESTGAPVGIEVGQFSATTPNYTRTKLAHLNSDYEAGDHHLSLRLSASRTSEIAAGQLPTEEFNSNIGADTNRITLSDVWKVRMNIFNELRFGYTKRTQDFPVDLPQAPGQTDVFANYEIDDLQLFIGPDPNFPQTTVESTLQISDTLSWIKGAHAFKGGLEFRRLGSEGGFLPRARGEYNYGSLDEFVRDQIPDGTNGALRGAGASAFDGGRNAYYAFAQDTWKVGNRLTLDLGVRYEYTSPSADNAAQDLNAIANIESIRGETDADGNNIFNSLTPGHQQLLTDILGDSMIFQGPKGDTNNFAPRLGFAWDVNGDGKTSVRGGFAIAHDVLFTNLDLLQLPPQFQVEVNTDIACAVSPSPDWCANAGDVRFSRGGFLQGGGLLNVVDPSASTSREAARIGTQAFLKDQVAPQTTTWSLSLQREIAKDYVAELRYIGTRGKNLPLQRRYNAGIPNPVELPIFASEADALSRSFAGAPTLADFGANQIGLLDPYGFQGAITVFDPVGKSWYDGVSIDFKRPFARGFGFDVNYTLSKTLDYGENELFTSLINPRRMDNSWDPASNKGRSGLDKTHKLVLTWQYELPGKNNAGLLGKIAGGWVLNGVFLYETGQALTILSGTDQNGNFDAAGDRAWENPNGLENVGSGVNNLCWDGAATSINTGCLVPDPDAPGQLVEDPSRIVGYVAADPNAQFVTGNTGAATGVGLNKTGRGRVHGPGPIHTLNLSLYRNFALGGSKNLRFGVDVVNVTNTPSYSLGTGSAIALADNGPAAVSNAFVRPDLPQFQDQETFSGGLGTDPFQRLIQFSAKLSF